MYRRRAGIIKILAIDDSTAILDLIKEILTIHKYEVRTAANGAEGLAAYNTFRPDIVTLDLSMPVMDGFETLRRIRSMDRDANVIMLTASEQQELMERCLERGAIGFVTKPFTPKELVAAINNAWKAGGNKNVATVFSLAAGKIEGSIKKMISSSTAASVILKDIKVIPVQKKVQALSPQLDVAQIKSVPLASEEEMQMQTPANSVGYVTEFAGQQRGTMISFISLQDLGTLFNVETSTGKNNIGEQAAEFFNIFNMKIVSELANATHLVLNAEPTRMHLQEQKSVPAGEEELTTATMDIIIDQKKIPVQVWLWFNTGHIFRSRF